MRITSIKLENFQGMKDLTINLNEKSASIYGDNGTGKTTIYNAFTWLMYDKPSTGEKSYTPKTTGSYNLHHSVEIRMQLESGTQIGLKKDFHEIYKTVRGSTQKTFAGHTTDYYIDGVPTPETLFNRRIEEIYKSPDILKMLTSPDYFLETMSIQDRRRILLEVCGGVTMEEVIEKHKDLESLPRILEMPGGGGTYRVEDFMEISKKRAQEISKKQTELPVRIDEAEKSKPDTAGNTKSSLSAELDALREKEQAEKDRLNYLPQIGKAELEKQIAEIESKIQTARSKQSGEALQKKIKENEMYSRMLSQIKDLKAQQSEHQTKSIRLEEEASRMKKRREELLKLYDETEAIEWTGDTICPTCGRPLPEEQIEAARAAFNLKRAKKLEEIVQEGKEFCSEDRINETEEKARSEREEMAQLEEKIEAFRTEFSAADHTPAPVPFEETKEYKELKEKEDELRNKEKEINSQDESIRRPILDEIKAIDAQILEATRKLADFDFADRQDKKIEEYKNQEEELAAEYETIQGNIYTCEQYMRAQAEELDSHINGKFRTIRFRLFQDQMNGGLKDDCEAMVPNDSGRMIPYKSANNAARINAGLEVIDTLSQHYGMQLPIFIDNAESVTKLEKTTTQTIRLVVSEPDKTLRVEAEE